MSVLRFSYQNPIETVLLLQPLIGSIRLGIVQSAELEFLRLGYN